MTTLVLRARTLRRAFSGRLVVDGLDLTLERGEILGLLGPNGAGKTTAFRMLAGLLRPDAGQVFMGDADVTAEPLHRRARRGLGYLPQEPTVFRDLTVLGNVELVLEARSGAPARPAMAFLEEAGLEGLAGARAGSLSGGERRRLELARCLALEPSVMLLDEPFAGVDPRAVADLQGRIRALAGRGIGVLLTDHAVREALETCTRVMVLDGGVLQSAGAPEEVAEDPLVRSRYLGDGFRL